MAPKPRHGGAPCVGESNDEGICYHPMPCPGMIHILLLIDNLINYWTNNTYNNT